MNNVIKIKNASYERYEELLHKKERLKKEAKEYEIAYNSIFGALNSDVYEARTSCVRKRKAISYCQSIIGMGSRVKRSEMNAFVDKAMQDYEKTLNFLMEDDKKDEKKLNDFQSKKEIKNIYRKLARLIHPDMHNNLDEDEVIQDLWNRTCVAYSCQDLGELQELDVLINNYLASINQKHEEIEIPNVNEKIFYLNREIDNIIHNNPYQYKFILKDEDSLKRKKEELEKELDDYIKYGQELDEEMKLYDLVIENDEPNENS